MTESRLDDLLAAILYLMSFYTQHQCPNVRAAIQQHLLSLTHLATHKTLPNLNATIGKIMDSYWADEDGKDSAAPLNLH